MEIFEKRDFVWSENKEDICMALFLWRINKVSLMAHLVVLYKMYDCNLMY